MYDNASIPILHVCMRTSDTHSENYASNQVIPLLRRESSYH